MLIFDGYIGGKKSEAWGKCFQGAEIPRGIAAFGLTYTAVGIIGKQSICVNDVEMEAMAFF